MSSSVKCRGTELQAVHRGGGLRVGEPEAAGSTRLHVPTENTELRGPASSQRQPVLTLQPVLEVIQPSHNCCEESVGCCSNRLREPGQNESALNGRRFLLLISLSVKGA